MRPKVRPGDYVFGVSPSNIPPRRIVFIGHVEERITFREAHERFPSLHGPKGPIHVEPVSRLDTFPRCSYAHIQGAMHGKDWERDLASRDLDAFFVCTPRQGSVGRWLGEYGPEVNGKILDYLRTCSVHGRAGELSPTNKDATLSNPIAHGRLYTGLHLETGRPEVLVNLCMTYMTTSPEHFETVPVPLHHTIPRQPCGSRKRTKGCR